MRSATPGAGALFFVATAGMISILTSAPVYLIDQCRVLKTLGDSLLIRRAIFSPAEKTALQKDITDFGSEKCTQVFNGHYNSLPDPQC